MTAVHATSFNLGPALSVRFSADALWLAVGEAEGVSLWSTEHGQRTAQATLRSGATSIDVAPDASRVAAADSEGNVTILELDGLRTVKRLSAPQPTPGTLVRFDAESATLVDGTWAGDLRVRDAETGAVRWAEKGDSIMRLAVSADRSTWVYDRDGTGGARVIVRRWPLSEQPAVALPGSPRPQALAVNRDGTRIAVYAASRLVVFGTDADGRWAEQARTDRLPAFMPNVTLAWTDDDLLILTLQFGLHVLDAELLSHGGTPLPNVCDLDFNRGLLAFADWEGGIVAEWEMVYERARSRPTSL